MIYAKQKVYQEGITEELILPPDPRVWTKPRGGIATTVVLVGVDSLPEEFITMAQENGWRFIEGKFYPTGE
jgi:hypothetical protein